MKTLLSFSALAFVVGAAALFQLPHSTPPSKHSASLAEWQGSGSRPVIPPAAVDSGTHYGPLYEGGVLPVYRGGLLVGGVVLRNGIPVDGPYRFGFGDPHHRYVIPPPGTRPIDPVTGNEYTPTEDIISPYEDLRRRLGPNDPRVWSFNDHGLESRWSKP